MKQINIGIAGCLGRMGQELIKEIIKDDRLNFSGGFENPKHKNINNKLSEIINVSTNHVVSDEPKKIFSQSDVIIDFTTPESTLQNIQFASDLRKPIVIGTTGLNDKIINLINANSKKIPILQSSNMSIGVNTLYELVKHTASVLQSSDYDIEISETHHKHKVDAPSGTAITVGKIAAKARNENFDKIKVMDRSKLSSKRQDGHIGFSVMRGGEIAGEHTVSFLGTNDRIDLVHKANNRLIFVQGAIKAAIFLLNKDSGLYSIEDVINSK